MAIPATRLDDKINATQFRAFAGLVLFVQAGYCNIATKDIPQVELSPVVQADLSTRRVCLDTDIALDIDSSYSPFHNIVAYRIQWGDGTDTGWVVAWPPGPLAYGAAAGEWPDFGTYTITISVRDDAGGGVGGPFEATIEEQIEVVDCTEFPFDAWAGLDGGGVYRVGSPWVARNAGLTGDWLTVYDIDVNTARTHRGEAEVWIATAAGVAVSVDGGEHWRKLALEDPEDTWGVGITAALLNYTMIARDVVNTDKCYVIAEYDSNPGNDEWVGYLLYTDDNFDTWTWKPLGGAYQAAGAWGYVQAVPRFFTAEGDQLDAITAALVNPTNATGAPNGQYGGFTRTYTNRTGACFHDFLYEIILDLGSYITLDPGTVDGGINVEMIIGALTDTMTYGANEPDIRLYGAYGGADWQSILHWDGAVDGYIPALPSTKNDNANVPSGIIHTAAFRFMKIRHQSAAYTGSGTCRMLIDGVRVYPDTVFNWFRPFAISVDKKTGRYLYMSMWNGDRNRLLVWDTEDMATWINERNIGGVDPNPDYRQAKVLSPKWLDAEVTGYETLVWGNLGGAGNTGIRVMPAIEYGTPFSKYGYPVVGFGHGDLAIAVRNYHGYAEWPYEDEMYVGQTAQIYYSIDAGASWATYGGNVGGDVAFVQLPQVGGLLNLDYLGELIVGNRDLTAGDATRITYSMDDGVTYRDVSTGLPATDVRVIRLLSER